MANNGKIEGKEVIDGLYDEIKKSDDALKKMLETMNTIKSSGFTLPGTTTKSKSTTTQYTGELDKIALKLKERQALIKKVAVAEERQLLAERKISQSLIKTRYETQQINKANKQSAILTSSYADAYDKLATRLAIAKRNLKNLTIEQGTSANATKKARNEVEKLTAKIKIADNSAGDFQRNVGNYPSAFKGVTSAVRGLVGAFGLIEGVRIAFDFTKESLALAREAKGVEFAFERVGETGVTAFKEVKESTRGLLSDLDIKRSLVEFDNFNISLEESATLFEFLSVRAAQTGKSVESLKDSLVEGLSKESKLRIDNLGISAAALNEELERTPDFVQAVANIAKVEVAKAGNILDEAANSSERLSKSFENSQVAFGQLFTDSEVGVLGFVSDQIDRITTSFKLLKISFGFLERGFNDIIKPIKQIAYTLFPSLKDSTFSFSSVLETVLTPGLTIVADVIAKFGAVLSGVANTFVASKNAAIDFINTLASFGDIDFTLNPLENFKKVKEFLSNSKDQFIKGGVEVANAFMEGYNDALNFKETKDKAVKEVNEIQDKVDEVNKNGYIKIKLDKVDATTTQELEKQLKKEAERIQEIFELSGFKFGEDAFDFEKPKEMAKALEDLASKYEKVAESSNQYAEVQKQIFKDTFNAFSEYYSLDLSAFEDLLDGKEALEINYASTANSIVESIYAGKQEKYNIDLERKRAYLDAVLSDETKTDKQKAIAQRKFDEEERKLNNKKAKAEKDAVLFKIAIDTAQGLAKTLITAFSLAANPLTAAFAPQAFAQAAAIGAFGAAQAAVVSSTKLPQFFKGKDANNNFEGLATWGEHRPEVLIDKYGGVEFSPNGTTPKFIKKDDIIVPSVPKFFNQIENPNSDVAKRISKRLGKETKERQMIINNSSANYSDNRKLEEKLDRLIALQAATTNRPINVKATIEQPYTKY